jgi:SAM-dependent methyltransferase
MSTFKESDIRPEAIFNRYLELSAKDAARCFGNVGRAPIPCVACGTDDARPEFSKNGFGYASCGGCGSLYQTPRPSLAAYEAFYVDSESSRYWAEEFFPRVAEARRERIFRNRVERLRALCRERGLRPKTVVDVGAGFGIFLDEWRTAEPGSRCIAVEPSSLLAEECRRKGFEVIQSIVEHADALGAEGDAVVCFEVLEHAHDPCRFLEVLRSKVRPGGYLFVTTLGVDGFDIQVLWEKSKSIFPPHHINFPSVRGFERMFQRAGFEAIEILTPGVLDVDIVRNHLANDPHALDGSRFVRRLVVDEQLGDSFQRFLADNRLSSHTWIVARRPLEVRRP